MPVVSRWRRTGSPCDRRRSSVLRGLILGALALTLGAASAHAMAARVRWMASDGPGVVGYDVFVRRSGDDYGASIDVGVPAPGPGGVLAHDVGNLADGVMYYFTVTARAADGTRSPCGGELALGNPDACLVEHCCPGRACTFTGMPFGAPCDDTNPCRVCRAAACATGVESPLDTLRLSATGGAGSTPRLSASGTFDPPNGLAPAEDGLTLSVLDAAGTILLRAFVPPDAVRGTAGGKLFVLARGYLPDGVQMLSIRLRDGAARVRARLDADPGAPSGPLSWVVASGASCGRSAALDCAATSRGLTCR